MKKLLIISAFTFISTSAISGMEDAKIHPLDIDKDGLISLSEAKKDATLTAIFSDLDVNKDGFLSKVEMEVKTEDKINE